jgi:hypothetical protein
MIAIRPRQSLSALASAIMTVIGFFDGLHCLYRAIFGLVQVELLANVAIWP